MKKQATLKQIAVIMLLLLSLVVFIEFIPDSTATISDHPCAPSNPDCDWKEKTVYKYYFVVPLICDEGHIHGDVVAILQTSWTAYWCAVHTDIWSEPPTFLTSGITSLYFGSCPDADD